MRAGDVPVTVTTQEGGEPFRGKITFIDNAVDTTTGTIRVKAEFANPTARLWPGAYVNVSLAPRTIAGATVVPAQSVQTGPDSRFVYVVGEDNKVTPKAVSLVYVEEGIAVIDGLPAGARIVVEGAQNLRPGSAVAEAQREGAPRKGEGKGKGEGKKKS
jgi:RND family efflux transporter MFP subunit